MLQKIKDFFNSTFGIVLTVLTAVIGVLVFFLKGKQSSINALKAQIGMVTTQKQADIIEAQIKEQLDNKNLLDKETKELQNSLNDLEAKRKQIASNEKDATVQQALNTWNKNQ